MENSQFEADSPIDSSCDYESENKSSDDNVKANVRQLETPPADAKFRFCRLFKEHQSMLY